ncbi:hypothetical protein PFLUV_G00093080 [Perca fluviatilis]|uniref:THAP-type domain-containing protein n=1 Tax=Perca fluviatilis TaxID=8168 RepID=A0A6A5EB46_PERFL|nr:uncharacterized protein LOC120563571 isoform X2 [Perca fluviatilis]KAF1386291.1 hypothetical protein PFLUV_G00093080 [Perca fluviatilis]
MGGRSCCVINCCRKSHDHRGRKIPNGLSFHCFPAWRTHEGEHVSRLTERRRAAWVAAVGRPDITFTRIPTSMRVCSRHFHSGKPAYEMLESDPDWVPSLHLDHREPNPRRTTRLLRSVRQENGDPEQRCTPPETRPAHETETRTAAGGAEKPVVRPWREVRSLLQSALQHKPNFSRQPGDETHGQTEKKTTDVSFRDLFRGALEASLDAYSRSRALSAPRPPSGSWEYDVELNLNLPPVKEEKQTCEESITSSSSSSSSCLSYVRLQTRNTELEEKLSHLTEEPETMEVPGTMQEPGTMELPGTMQEPGTMEVPETMEVPGTMELPEIKEEPETMKGPETMEEPEIKEEPETMKGPETMEVPEIKEEPETMKGPETMEEPDIKEEPETMKGPETMEVPEIKEEPETMVVPETMEVPEIKEEPENIEVSTVPEMSPQSPWRSPAKEDKSAYPREDRSSSLDADLEPGEVRELSELSEDSETDARPPKNPDEDVPPPRRRGDQNHAIGKSCGRECRRRCRERIGAARREALHAEYWSMSYEGKKAFVSSNVPRRQTAVQSGAVPGRRKQTLSYQFTDDLGLTQRVCKTFFLTTLGYNPKNDRIVQMVSGNGRPRSRGERRGERSGEASDPASPRSEITVELHQLETGDTQRWNVTEYIYSSTGLQSKR